MSEPMMEAARVLMESALEVLDKDPHSFGTRGCSTCRFVTSLRGKPFGCNRVALQRATPPGPAKTGGET